MRPMFRAAGVAAVLLALSGCERAKMVSNDTAPANAAAPAKGGSIFAGLEADPLSSKFVAAIKAAGLEPTLAGKGAYTVLAPTDAAFARLPAGSWETLTSAAGRPALVALLTNHVLPGVMLTGDIAKAVETGKGKAVIMTMGSGTLTATRDGPAVVLASGDTRARIGAADEPHANGVVHHIDALLIPVETARSGASSR